MFRCAQHASGEERRARFVILLAAVLLLLPLLAVLQYRWLGQVSEGERARMRAVQRSASAQFSATFDREITRAYSIFQHHQTGALSAVTDAYMRRWREWETSASHPRIVRDLFLVVTDAEGAPHLLRFDHALREVQEIAWPHELELLRRQGNEATADYILEQLPALIIPSETAGLSNGTTPRLLCTVVLLDLDYIKQTFIPALASRYFAASEGLEYDLAIVSQSDPRNVIFQTPGDLAETGAKSDAATSLFDVRLETLLGKPWASAAHGGSPAPEGAVLRVVKRQRIGAGADDETTGRWRLLVRHHAGSLEEAVANGRRRNLAISFGILLVLAVSVGLIVVASRRATRLAQEQMKFVAGVSHELRTPLAVIYSAGENLADGVVTGNEQVQEYGGLIRNEGRRLSQMVEQVLQYGGAQSGRQPYRLQPTALREIIDGALTDCRQAIEEGGFEIETEIEANLPSVNADAAALQSALQNLLSNAIKYDGESRWIALRANKRPVANGGEELQITVEDRGRGIAARDLPHIFEPFYRASDVVAAQIRGSGLGLSLVQHIVTAHRGRVSVTSKPGEGSAFTLHLPIATENAS